MQMPAYHWNWELLSEFLIRKDGSGQLQPGLLLRGLIATLRIGFWTILFSFIVGGLIGALSIRKNIWIKWPLTALVNILRSTPPLVILFCVYFFAGNLLPIAPIENAIRACPEPVRNFIAATFASPGQIDAMLAAVLALGIYQSAYVAEIIRGGLQAVPAQQWDAAIALGFNRRQTLLLVILPQALRLIIPTLTGQCISTFKESALASLISLPELTFQSLEIMAVSDMTFEIWIAAGLLYMLLGVICTAIGRAMERRHTYTKWSHTK